MFPPAFDRARLRRETAHLWEESSGRGRWLGRRIVDAWLQNRPPLIHAPLLPHELGFEPTPTNWLIAWFEAKVAWWLTRVEGAGVDPERVIGLISVTQEL